MHKVTSVEAMPGYKLSITFEDGTEGVVCLEDRLFGPVFEPLKDPEFFSKAAIDEFGVVCWPNSADLAPDALYEKIKLKASAS